MDWLEFNEDIPYTNAFFLMLIGLSILNVMRVFYT